MKAGTEPTLATARRCSAQDYVIIQLLLCLENCEYKVDHASDSTVKSI